MGEQLFIELSIIILTTGIVSAIMMVFKQPIMIGYLLSGIILSPSILNILHSAETIDTLSKIGITLLLFIVGIQLNPQNIKEVGKPAIITASGQVLLSAIFGFLLTHYLLGFDAQASIYIAIGLSFSSTIVIMKLLADKKDLQSLYGRISIGILIVQDLFAMIILMIITSLSKQGDLTYIIIETLLKGAGLTILLILISKKILPIITKKIATNQEFLLLFSISWCLALASLFYYLDFSIEIGALLAGVTLSFSPYRYEIAAKMKPLRDFFIMIFFVMIGSHITFDQISQYILTIITIITFVLILNPLIILSIMGILGYTKKNAFKTALISTQISEFALIIATIGHNNGHINQTILSILTLTTLLTIIASTYIILNIDLIYQKLNKYLNCFEKKGHKIDQLNKKNSDQHEIIMLGYSKLGAEISKSLQQNNHSQLIIDFDPKNIQNLTKENIDCRYGDMADLELYEEINFSKAKMVISNIQDIETNLLAIHHIRSNNSSAIIIVVSHNIEQALILYEHGANYVIMPNILGGEFAAHLISEHGFDLEAFFNKKQSHIRELLIKKTFNHGKN